MGVGFRMRPVSLREAFNNPPNVLSVVFRVHRASPVIAEGKRIGLGDMLATE